jgi:hypothetical protein
MKCDHYVFPLLLIGFCAAAQSEQNTCSVNDIKFKTNRDEILSVSEVYECYGNYNKSKEIDYDKKCLTDEDASKKFTRLQKKYPQDYISYSGSTDFIVKLNGVDYVLSDVYVPGTPHRLRMFEKLKHADLMELKRKSIKIQLINRTYLEAFVSDFSSENLSTDGIYRDRRLKLVSCN